jgi:hypothetical protein
VREESKTGAASLSKLLFRREITDPSWGRQCIVEEIAAKKFFPLLRDSDEAGLCSLTGVPFKLMFR